MVNPCVPECKERSVTCHGTCEKYKTWKAEYEEQKKFENRLINRNKNEAIKSLDKTNYIQNYIQAPFFGLQK